MESQLLAAPSSAPRASTPLGPHPMSPEKQPPSPLDPASSIEVQAPASAERPSSAASTITERPLASADPTAGLSVPPKAPSVDSNFSSVQGKTAGTPPTDEADKDDDLSDSSIWQEENAANSQPPLNSEQSLLPTRAANDALPDWMTDELDESWPDQDPVTQSKQAASSAPVPPAQMLTRPPDTSITEFQSLDPASSAAPTRASRLPSATPSSRAFFDARESSALPNPAFSEARRRARRALLRSRPSAAAPLREAATDTELQAGPSTPSMRLPSHQQRRSRLRQISSEEDIDNGNSTIWSAGDSDSDSDSALSAPDDFESARGSLLENSRISNLQPTQTHPAPTAAAQSSSPASSSVASGAKGTFIHKADVSSLPPILRPVWQSPAKGQGAGNRKGLGGIGGDMFTPMRLQTMFKTPTPPERSVHNIMDVLTAEASSARSTTASNHQRESSTKPQLATENDLVESQSAAAVSSGPPAPPAHVGYESEQTPPTDFRISVPTSAFTFQSPKLPQTSPPKGTTSMPPSKSLQNMQTLQVTSTLARPASAAANLGVQSPAGINPPNLVSGPPTPHTPMRLFNFNYDDAATRARLEEMVIENSPAHKQPIVRAEVERERKRLRLDIRPRKVVTGDLMEMPEVVDGKIATQLPTAVTESNAAATGSSGPPPPVDYVKESADFMTALQQMVRKSSGGTDGSKDWVTDEDDVSPSASREEEGSQQAASGVSFHQGSTIPSPARSQTSPARQRRSLGTDHARHPGRPEVAATAMDVRSPERLSTRRLPADSSLRTEATTDDLPMSSTLKSRESLSRHLPKDKPWNESPRKLLRRISAAAIAEDEVMQEFEEREGDTGDPRWKTDASVNADALSQRDQQIRELEQRIARRRQERRTAAAASAELAGFVPKSHPDQIAASRPQLITLHEPTLETINGGHTAGKERFPSWDEDGDLDEENDEKRDMEEAGTRRFQDGIVLYDSEKILMPPVQEKDRPLRNMASAVELRSRGPDGRPTKQSTLLALPSQPNLYTDASAAILPEANVRRGDRTTSSNTLVDPSLPRTVSGDIGSHHSISDLGGKGATITRTGSLFNISQIPEQEIENLGRGKLTFNKELNKWEKMPRNRTSQEDLRSAVGSRGGKEAVLTSKSTVPVIPEASVELSRDEDVFSDTPSEKEARTQPGAKTNAFQQRLGNVSTANLSDSTDPFREFESIGHSSNEHAPGVEAQVADDVKRNTSTPETDHRLRPVQPASQEVDAQRKKLDPKAGQITATTDGQTRHPVVPRSPVARVAVNSVPRSGSSLRNVVTYSPDTTSSSHHSAVSDHHMDEPRNYAEPEAQTGTRAARYRDRSPPFRPRHVAADSHATPIRDNRRPFGSLNPTTPTPIASASSISTPKSILKQPAVVGLARGEYEGRGSASYASNIAVMGTPNRTISFVDPAPRASRKAAVEPRESSFGLNFGRQNDRRADEDESQDEDVTLQATGDRTEAISSALRALAELTLGGGDDTQLQPRSQRPTPSKVRDAIANRSHWSYRTLKKPRRSRYHQNLGEEAEEAEASWQEDSEYDELHGYPDMTLLTDASFNFAHDKVLEAITDVEPWEPGWDELISIDLSQRRLESCVRLKEFLPVLEEIDLHQNELSYLTGIPNTVRVLNLGSNRLTTMASFGHLLHLEEVDVSHNQLDSLTHFSCLKHLHTLKADRNDIASLDGIDKLRSLTHLSLSGNQIKGVNLSLTQWTRLETLELSHNQLLSIRGLSSMARLKSLNLDHNQLSMIDLSPSMPKLRVLRASGNPNLQELDVSPATKLRTLYVDYCDLTHVENLHLLVHLDNLSMRQQLDAAILWPVSELKDVKRLFLSGNAFPHGIATAKTAPPNADPFAASSLIASAMPSATAFLNLVYLELSACQLTDLPSDFAQLAPNLRSLNLDHNLLSSLPFLGTLSRLKRLSAVGCRIKKSKSIIRALRGLPELQVLDTRTNPCTLGMYPPLVVPSAMADLGDRAGEGRSPNPGSWVSHLPPIPNSSVVQPDRSHKRQQQSLAKQRSELYQAEKSYFHKRRPPTHDYAVDKGNTTTVVQDLIKDHARGTLSTLVGRTDAGISDLFQAADKRFVRTLPKHFVERRILHRGLLAMSCPKLNWIDGLLISEDEIVDAEELVQSKKFEVTTPQK